MNPIKFTHNQIDHLHEFQYSPKEHRSIGTEESLFSNPVLGKSWAEQEVNNLFYKFGITSIGPAENILLYSFLIGELSKNLKLYAIALGETTILKNDFKDFELVKWEYHITHEEVVKDEYIKEDHGFKSALTLPYHISGKEVITVPKNQTGLFHLQNFNDIINVLQLFIQDAFLTINCFCINPGREGELLTFLRSRSNPMLNAFLETNEAFICLNIGHDPGYYDFLVIKSKEDISNNLVQITNKISDFSIEYINAIPKLNDIEELMGLIQRLRGKYIL